MSQCERIVQYINQHGSITQAEAMNDLGCYRLASRITDLKKLGFPIVSVWEEGKNRHDEKVRYKRYSLAKNQEGAEP